MTTSNTTAALSVAAFCERYGIGRTMFYRLVKEGRAPAVTKIGKRTLIGIEAAAAWWREMQAATASSRGGAK